MKNLLKLILSLSIQGAGRCAWRALYFSLGSGYDRRQFAHIGIDPTASGGPQLFGGLGSFSFRFVLPHISWREVGEYEYAPEVKAVYQLQQRLLRRLDGRFTP